MQIEEILIIKNGHESFGISTEDIDQISRVPDIITLPLRPNGVRGLCSLGGGVVSVVDMNLLLGMKSVDIEADKSRLVNLCGDISSNTLLVSDVFNTVVIKEENIEYIDIENDPVIAIYKHEDLLVQIISLETLFERINGVKIAAKEIQSVTPKEQKILEESSSRFLIFSMSNERYALDINYLQEIILADREFTQLAGSDEEVLGLITLRDELLVIIDMRVHYGFAPKHSEANRILVISHENKKMGVCVDSIVDIKSFYKKDIEYMNDSNFDESKIAGVIHDDESLISFFDAAVIENIFKENEKYIDVHDDSALEEETQAYAKEVIIFKLADKEYAFDVDSVAEIIDVVDSTSVAFSDESIEGIINIHGQIVTTISLFHKLSLPMKVNEDAKIIICNINDTKIGFVVDSVSDILGVKESEIREESEGYFENVLHLEDGKRLVLSMDIQKILGEDNG